MKPRDIDNASAGELEQIEEATGRMTREPLEKLREAVYAAERRVSEYSVERQAELESAARATIRDNRSRHVKIFHTLGCLCLYVLSSIGAAILWISDGHTYGADPREYLRQIRASVGRRKPSRRKPRK